MAVGNKIEKFEDLKAWQIGKELTNDIYKLTQNPEFSKDYGLKDQIRRAAVSSMSNVAEGYERGSNKDFIKFLFIARGSIGEVRSLLNIALDLEYITKDEYNRGHSICVEGSKIIWGLIKSLRSKVNWTRHATLN